MPMKQVRTKTADNALAKMGLSLERYDGHTVMVEWRPPGSRPVDSRLTARMREIQLLFHLPLEDVIRGPLRQVQRRLHSFGLEVSRPTISDWQRRLGIREGATRYERMNPLVAAVNQYHRESP
jgi:hypothetical protein